MNSIPSLSFLKNKRNCKTDIFEITFLITNQCNLRCTYCYEKKTNNIINLKNCYAVIDRLFDIEKNIQWWNNFININTKKIIFHFFGGECFLYPDLMDNICSYFVKKCNNDIQKYQERLNNFEIKIQTNGTLLQTENSKKFLNKWERYIKDEDMFISIDGTKKSNDSCRKFKDSRCSVWDLVSKNIRWYISTFHKTVSTKGTISPENIYSLYDNYLEYKKLGFKNIRMTIRDDQEVSWKNIDLNKVKGQYMMILKDLLKNPYLEYNFNTFDITNSVSVCNCNGGGIALDYSDKIYSCFYFSSLCNDKQKAFFIGDVNKGIYNIENINILQNYKDKSINNDNCKKCNYIYNCYNKCPAASYLETGTFNGYKNRSCDIIKIEQSIAIYYNYLRKKIYGN